MQELSVIIICESALVSGGGEAVAIATALELRARGVRVGYIAGNDKADPRLVEAGVELLLLDQQSFFEEPDRNVKLKKLKFNPKIDMPVMEFMRKFDPDTTVVHAHTFRLKLSGRVPALFADEGYVVFTHGHDYSPICPTSLYFNHRTGQNCKLKPLSMACITCECQGIPWRYKVPKLTSMFWNQKKALLNQRTTGFLYPSVLAQEVMMPFLPKDAQHHQFRPIGKDAPHQRVHAENNKEVMFVGRVTHEKGPELLLQASESLSIPVAIVGDGPLLKELKKKYPNARYTGWVPNDQMATELAKARALVV
ncbi:MAG TPA: glycosyltransferase, partial [Fimbriimonas sp.]|nr:glycosyltransferase [Fimbriimonas sp.]